MQIKSKIVFKFNVQFEFASNGSRKSFRNSSQKPGEGETNNHLKFVHVEIVSGHYNTFALITHLHSKIWPELFFPFGFCEQKSSCSIVSLNFVEVGYKSESCTVIHSFNYALNASIIFGVRYLFNYIFMQY